MGKSTISMVIFNSYVKLPEGISTLSTESAMHKGQEGQEGNIWLHPSRYFIPDLKVLEIVTYLLNFVDMFGYPGLESSCFDRDVFVFVVITKC